MKCSACRKNDPTVKAHPNCPYCRKDNLVLCDKCDKAIHKGMSGDDFQ